MISDYDKIHIDQIIAGSLGDWFTAQLLRLCAKADGSNLERLRRGFPEEVEAYERWYRGLSQIFAEEEAS